MKKEEWRFIPGYEGLYMVSNWGRVKSLYRGKEHILKPAKSKWGYLKVSLSKDKKQKMYAIHILVWTAFGDRPRNGLILQIDHINGIKTDNSIENLQLLSCRENVSKAALLKEGKTSKYTGVSWSKCANKWKVSILINKKRYYLGLFESEDLAKDAYQYALINQEEIINRISKKTSKYKGVTWHKKRNKWQTQIRINNKTIYIGTFDTEKEAAEAYLKAKENLNPEN